MSTIWAYDFIFPTITLHSIHPFILENSTFQKNLSPAAYTSVLSNLTELAQKLEKQGK